MAGIVIFSDFCGFISKSGKIYSIDVSIQSYDGLAKNITLILPAVICNGEVLQLSNAEIVEINGELYYKIQIANLSYKYDHLSFECLNKKRPKDVHVSNNNVYVYFENAEKLKVDCAVYVAQMGREGYLLNLLLLYIYINKSDCGKWIPIGKKLMSRII